MADVSTLEERREGLQPAADQGLDPHRNRCSRKRGLQVVSVYNRTDATQLM